MNRREALRTLAAGSAAGALAGGAVFLATPAKAETMTPIERMAIDLRARYDRDTSSMSKAEADASTEEFHALLDRMLRIEPQTPRDVAMQWHADCLFGTSDNSEEFRERLIAMAGISEGAAPKPDMKTDIATAYTVANETLNASDIEDEAVEAFSVVHIDPLRDRLLEDAPIPTTMAGALAAARLAERSLGQGDCELAEPLIVALRQFLDGRA